MASRYVPPALRKKSADQPQDRTTEEDIPNESTVENLSRRKLSDLTLTDEHRRSLYTQREIAHHFGYSTETSTLHDSAEKPHQLAVVILFRNANPRWYPDRIIFAHTNIDILPGYHQFKKEADQEVENSDQLDVNIETAKDEIDVKDTDSEASLSNADMIPIFMELAGPKAQLRKFVFHGYFRLARVEFLKPHSPGIVRLLQQKWEPANDNPNRPPLQGRVRDTEAWKKSMSQEWAVIKMSKVSDNELVDVEEPVIESLADVVDERSTRKDRSFGKRFDGQVHDQPEEV